MSDDPTQNTLLGTCYPTREEIALAMLESAELVATFYMRYRSHVCQNCIRFVAIGAAAALNAVVSPEDSREEFCRKAALAWDFQRALQMAEEVGGDE